MPRIRNAALPAAAILAPAATAVLLAPAAHAGDCLSPAWLSPFADRWNYPFNTTPGTKPDAKVFGTLDPDFDNRDGTMVFGFDTTDQVPAGLPLDQYRINSARITVQVESEDTFTYDPTFDGWATYLDQSNPDHVPDADPGRPVELFGAAFRSGFTALTWEETTPYSAISSFGKFMRTCWPLAFDDDGNAFDVSNTVDEQIDPAPFAIGLTDEVSPGSTVPQLTTFEFEIDLDDPNLHGYFQQGLRDGRLLFTIASMFPAEKQVGGTFPDFFTKEAPAVEVELADAAQLFIDVQVGRRGDTDNSGAVDITDLLAVLASWGACPGAPCPEDTNCDGVVDILDLLIVLGDWG